MDDGQHSARFASELSLANFLRTSYPVGEPSRPHSAPGSLSRQTPLQPRPLYYLPHKLLPEQEAQIEKQQREAKEAVDAQKTAWEAEKADKEVRPVPSPPFRACGLTPEARWNWRPTRPSGAPGWSRLKPNGPPPRRKRRARPVAPRQTSSVHPRRVPRRRSNPRGPGWMPRRARGVRERRQSSGTKRTASSTEVRSFD